MAFFDAIFFPEVSVPDSESFFQKNEFLIRRLHSLSGLVPVGAYMCVHLVTNASILNGSETFQNAVYQIHSLGNALFAVEWLFIFLPIIFHAVFGFVIMFGGKSNLKNYRYGGNVRYVLQRVTGMIAFVFIFLHVFHLHGWFHFDIWLKSVVEPLGGGQFLPYKASSTLASALQASFLIPTCYVIGLLSCVFHFANGLWTMGITWGVWTSPNAQKRAGYLIAAGGILLSLIGLSAIAGFTGLDAEKAEKVETQMYENAVEGKRIPAAPHKFYGHDENHHEEHN